ncbi:MAG: vWA domain-containing protein [Myxococcota bacterium]
MVWGTRVIREITSVILVAGVLGCSSGRRTTDADSGTRDATTDTGVDTGSDAARRDTSVPDGGECAGEVALAEPIPVDLILMLDRSGSMLFPTESGQAKWDVLTGSLNDFLLDDDSAELGLGLSVFPQNVPGVPNTCVNDSQCGTQGPCVLRVCQEAGVRPCTDDADCSAGVSCLDFGWCAANNAFGCFPIGGTACTSTGGPGGECVARSNSFCRLAESCDVAQYATPSIEVGPVASVRSDVMLAFATERPAGISSTPTWAALQGAHAYAREVSDANPDHRVAVILATDGLPSGRCTPRDLPTIETVASTALAADPGIPTYVVGVFADSDTDAQANLNAIAAAGGTETAFISGTGADAAERLVAALESIREASFSCDQQLPEAPDGMTLDLTRINVEFLSGTGRSVIPFVEDAEGCDETLGGWHYSGGGEGEMPDGIALCPATCESVNRQPDGRLEIRVGCETVLI